MLRQTRKHHFMTTVGDLFSQQSSFTEISDMNCFGGTNEWPLRAVIGGRNNCRPFLPFTELNLDPPKNFAR
jgi:hypothetical protein